MATTLITGSVPDSSWTDLINNTNFPGIIVLAAAAIPASWAIVKGLVKLQKDFIDYYGEQNKKLKLELEAVEKKNDELEGKNSQMAETILDMKLTIGRLEIQIEAQNATIKRLEGRNQRGR